MKLLALYNAIYLKAKKFIDDCKKDTDTNSGDFFNKFSYIFWDGHKKADIKELKAAIKILLSPKYKAITELNLAVADLYSNWRELPIELLIANYLNDFLNYLIPRIVNLGEWETGFKKAYHKFEEEFLSGESTIEYFGHLGNFQYRFDGTGELNEHTRLITLYNSRQWVNSELECNRKANYFKIKRVVQLRYPHINENVFKDYPLYLYYTKKIRKESIIKKKYPNPYFLLQKFILGTRLVSSFYKPYWDFVVIFYQGNLNSFFPRNCIFISSNQVGTRSNTIMLGGVEFTWLERLWTELEGISYLDRLINFDHHLDDSLRRDYRSKSEPGNIMLKTLDELDKLSDYFSAFDSLYKDKAGRGKEAIAKITAILVTYRQKLKDYGKIKAFIAAMYEIRNDYTHGRMRIALKKAGKYEDFKNNVYKLGAYLRQVAILYTMNDDFESQLPAICSRNDFSKLKTIYF